MENLLVTGYYAYCTVPATYPAYIGSIDPRPEVLPFAKRVIQ